MSRPVAVLLKTLALSVALLFLGSVVWAAAPSRDGGATFFPATKSAPLPRKVTATPDASAPVEPAYFPASKVGVMPFRIESADGGGARSPAQQAP